MRSATGPDYGRLKFERDSNIVLDEESLPFSLSSPSKYGLEIGVTYSAGNAGGSVAFDDVSLLVTPR